MSVTSLEKDESQLTLTLIADFGAPVDRVWQLWADPRLLERWWGPPGYPATMTRHDLSPGGEVAYHMTGPDGKTYPGWWRVVSTQPPTALEFVDGFADQDGLPSSDMPVTTVRMRLSEHGGGTRMDLRFVYANREDMDKVLAMGHAEGVSLAVGQMDGLLSGSD